MTIQYSDAVDLPTLIHKLTFNCCISVVVDMNDTRSIELANSWKQEFANKVTRTRKVTEILPDGTQTSHMGLLPCDSSLIPVLLLGNKYDLVRDGLIFYRLMGRVWFQNRAWPW